MGAWIETSILTGKRYIAPVAPYVGAWIETLEECINFIKNKSHPTWVRGLKQKKRLITILSAKSHPTWVRGLKPDRHSNSP